MKGCAVTMPIEAIKAVAEATPETIKAVAGLIDSVGVKDLVQLGVNMTQRGVDAGAKAYTKKAEERDSLVEVPELISSDYHLKLDDAIRWLEEDGFRTEAVVVKPDVSYKDCEDLEVVATNYELKKKLKHGTRIILRYVTSDVIEASQKLFEESEKQKAKATQKKTKQAKINKKKREETVANVQKGVGNVLTNTQKGLKGVIDKIPKKSKKNVSIENTDEK